MKHIEGFFATILVIMLSFVVFTTPAHAAQLQASSTNMATPPNSFKVVKTKDGNYYSLYNLNGSKCAAFHRAKHHAKAITIHKYVIYKGKKYKVVAIHEFGLFERTDIKKVTIKADNMETIEEPALYKQWRKDHHKKVKVVCKDRDTRKWLNAKW